MKAKYSIFLPVKNGQLYVAKAIESVLAQQVSDFVLIILENKSTDDSLSIIRSYHDPRITVIEAPRDLSIYENWRRIYELMSSGVVGSEFSTILGHDDIYNPDFLSTIEGLISSYPDASLYQTHFNLIDKTGKIQRPCYPIPLREFAKDFFLALCWENRDSYGTGYVFRTNDYLKVGGMANYPLLLYSDHLLVIRLAKLSFKVCSGHSSFRYRLYKESTSGAISPHKCEALIEAAKRYLIELEKDHHDLVTEDFDKIALGYFMARLLDWYDFPFSRTLLGAETAENVEEITIKTKVLLQGNTLNGLSNAHFLDQLYSIIRKTYMMGLFLKHFISCFYKKKF